MKRLILLIFIMFVSVGIVFSQSLNVTKPAAGVTWNKGTTKTITWTSPGCQSGDVKINIFKNSASVPNFVLQLTGPNTGSKSWNIPSDFIEGNYIIRVKTDPAETGCLGDSGLFTIGPAIIITTFQPMTVEAFMIKPPDLEIKIIPIPESPDIYQKTLVEFRVKNIGEGTSKATKMKVFMASANTNTWNVGPLAPGRFMYKTKEITPDGVGYIAWSANVDENNNIGDKNRANNYAKYKMIIKGPDLVVAFDGNIRSIITTTATVKGYVKNVGHAKSKPCKLNIYMENKGSENFNIPALNPGQVYEVSRGKKYYIAQTITVKMTIDVNGDVKEENEKNNYIQESIKIVVSSPYFVHKYVCSNGKTGGTLNEVW